MAKVNRAKTMFPYTGDKLQDYTGFSIKELRKYASKVGPTARNSLEVVLRNPDMLKIQGDVRGVNSKGQGIHGALDPTFYRKDGGGFGKTGVVELYKSGNPRDTAIHEINHLGDWLSVTTGSAGNKDFEDNSETSTRQKLASGLANTYGALTPIQKLINAGGEPRPYNNLPANVFSEYRAASNFGKQADKFNANEMAINYGMQKEPTANRLFGIVPKASGLAQLLSNSR